MGTNVGRSDRFFFLFIYENVSFYIHYGEPLFKAHSRDIHLYNKTSKIVFWISVLKIICGWPFKNILDPCWLCFITMSLKVNCPLSCNETRCNKPSESELLLKLLCLDKRTRTEW